MEAYMKKVFFTVFVFTAVLLTSGSLAAQTSCELDDSILESNAVRYFAFKGVGQINAANVEDPNYVFSATPKLVGISGRDLDYADEFSFFEEYDSENEGSGVLLTALGDPDMDTAYFTTAVFARIPQSYFERMQETNSDTLSVAPVVEVYDITLSKDNNYIKLCVIASNKRAGNDEFSNAGVGKIQVCQGQNTEFSVGEKITLAMNAELVTGNDILGNYEDAETLEDLCECSSPQDNTPVDCSAIEWEDNNTDPESGDAEHYFAFKGKGRINREDLSNLYDATVETAELVGVEDKTLSSNIFFHEYTIQNTDPDTRNWVALSALGDIDHSGYVSTFVFVLIPVYYLNYMIEDELDKMPFAPITQVYDYRYTDGHVFARECLVASNKQGSTEYGEAGVGEFQVVFENNINFTAGETFNLTMMAELVVGQELIDSYEDVETADDLCRCFKVNGNDVNCSEIDWGDGESSNGGDDTDASDTGETDTDSDVSDSGENDEDSGNSDVEDAVDTDTQNENGDVTDKKSKSDGCSMLFV